MAIKAIEAEKYKLLSREQGVSEARAMELCHQSDYIANLIEEFKEDDNVFLVTKFVKGGDLLHYLNETLGVNKLSEIDAKFIFH